MEDIRLPDPTGRQNGFHIDTLPSQLNDDSQLEPFIFAGELECSVENIMARSA